MLEFDLALLSKLSLTEAIFYRHCDDILIICDLEKEDDIYEFVYDEIRRLGLNLQKKKRNSATDADGKPQADKLVHHLGFSFDGQRAHIRSASITRYYKNFASVFGQVKK